jgi:hypothetical protein
MSLIPGADSARQGLSRELEDYSNQISGSGIEIKPAGGRLGKIIAGPASAAAFALT